MILAIAILHDTSHAKEKDSTTELALYLGCDCPLDNKRTSLIHVYKRFSVTT